MSQTKRCHGNLARDLIETGLLVIDTPGIVGHVTPHLHTLLQAQWGVDHEKSILIGVLEV